ncbi:PepSY domain-containing protein [Rhizobium sp. DKSPLA3]|uniref:PepSY domain-containing protein n=1 Tax=Rhizobium quercicola TaxID=2901226 RepID=A0A9X1T5P1_9HYPH|nr:PepSY domain-containing protein [Rhizobium quercicola]MCD7107938.1 PepSY domain-containing protein [Rhizobium quercicola]
MFRCHRLSRFAAVATVSVLCLAAPAISDDGDDRLDQEAARQALAEGRVRPLEDIIAHVRQTIKGDIIEIEFERDNGRFVYELEILQETGHLLEIVVDARTMDILP